nr:hypothetical protein [Tanacetum cinerariifolium]
MEEIKTASVGAYQYLVDKDPCTWSRAYFKEGMDCDAVENGLSESFNSHIKNARRKPIIGMLEDIRSYVMTRNYTLRKECEDWKSEICPNIKKVLELHKKIQRKWTLSPTMYFINTNPDDYVSESFKVSTYKSIYAFNILPVGGKKDKSEMKNQKHVARPPRSMTCKNCGETGHNKNGCEKPKVPREQANPANEQANPISQQALILPSATLIQQHQLLLGSTKFFTSSIKHLVFFFKIHGSINSKANSCGIWMGGTSASGSNRGKGSAIGSSRGRGSASGSNRGRGRGRSSGSNKVVVVKKPVVERYILLDEDDLVDVQVEEEVDTRDENVVVGAENVASETAEQDEKKDGAARLKKRMRHVL